MTSDLLKNPQQYGIAPNTLIRLDGQPSPDHAAYLDLIDSRNQSWSNQGLAVIEDQGNALLYLLPADAPQCRQKGGLGDLINILACRGDARYVAVVHAGRLDFYPLRLQLAGEPQARYSNIPTTSLHAFLTGVLLKVGPKRKQQKADKRWLDTFLFRLLTGTADALRAAEPQLSHGQILSLVGRALFSRFIADRGILLDSDAANVTGEASVQSLSQLFDSASTLAHACAWLDKTFNGNLLEMDVPGAKDGNPSATQYEAFFKRYPKTHEVLRDVLNNAPEGQRQLGWQDIKFQHVPADMLSQVYEHFAHQFQAEKAKKTSIHYTPRRIAQQLVNAAFAGSELQTKSRAHVLDPTVGAGVFLVLAYKRLVRERWQETGKRPQRVELRSILNSQLCGLDINKESLKFAALSLYLTALELDPNPTPLSDLTFDDLNGCVLRFVGASEYAGLGSLHNRWAQHTELRNRFDLVVGNPPWTKPKNQPELISQYTEIVQTCARRTGLFDDAEVKKLVSDSGKPDPVFVWRVLDWLKSDGMMALALHAQHMLFERGNGYELRKALLKRIELTGALNGSALRDSPIWPSHAAPFCLWVARNRLPQENSSFYFLNPYEEASLVEREQYRLDMRDALVVQQSIAISTPYAFKTLAKGGGTALQIMCEIRNRLSSKNSPQRSGELGDEGVKTAQNEVSTNTVKSYWKSRGLKSSYGFQVATGGKLELEGKLHTAPKLVGKPLLDASSLGWSNGYVISLDGLDKFQSDRLLYRGFDAAAYQAPLVLIEKTPKVEQQKARSWISWLDVTYSEAFYGYPCGKGVQGILLARYLQLLLLSNVFEFFVLMSSSEFGIEREKLHKKDIDEFPILPIEKLNAAQCSAIEKLSANLHIGKKSWDAINKWACELYGLNVRDAQVISDTLATSLPFTANQSWADAMPELEQGDQFVRAVHEAMRAFAEVVDVPLRVDFVKDTNASSNGWWFVRVNFGQSQQSQQSPKLIELPTDWVKELAAANQLWASQVQLHSADETVLWIGILAQNRFWTVSRAKALAQQLLHEELEKHVPAHSRSGAL